MKPLPTHGRQRTLNWKCIRRSVVVCFFEYCVHWCFVNWCKNWRTLAGSLPLRLDNFARTLPTLERGCVLIDSSILWWQTAHFSHSHCNSFVVHVWLWFNVIFLQFNLVNSVCCFYGCCRYCCLILKATRHTPFNPISQPLLHVVAAV